MLSPFANKLSFARILLTLLALCGISALYYATPDANANNQDFQPAIDYKVDLNPNLGIDKDLLACKQQRDALVVNILQPTANQTFFTGSIVQLNGQYTYNCSDANYDTLSVQWFLNGQKVEHATELSSALSGLAEGAYTLNLQVKISEIEQIAESSFRVVQPSVVVTPQPLNNGPIASITSPNPNDPAVTASNACANKTYYCTTVRFAGTGQDTEDGQLIGAQLAWYNVTNNNVYLGQGASLSAELYSPQCTSTTYNIKLVATDSAGAVGSAQINVTVWGTCPIFLFNYQ